MAHAVVMPKLGLSMTEGTIIKWLKNEGDRVKRGDGLVEIETEKITHTVEAKSEGVLLKILAQTGDVYAIATPIAYIGEPGEKLPNDAGIAPHTPAAGTSEALKTDKYTGKTGRIKISPLAKATAAKLNIDYTGITGTGPGSRIVKADILKCSIPAAEEPAVTGAAPSGAAAGKNEPASVIPYTGMRKAIGTKLSLSKNVAPSVTHHVSADVTGLLDLRQALNTNLKDGQTKVSVTDMLARIIAKALTKHLIMNSTLAGDEIRLLKEVHIGIAVAIDNGLVVPVIRNADRKDVFTISREIKDLAERARGGRLQANEMKGSTFTISNLGGYGSVDFFTPIINQPESAILGLGRTKKVPTVINDEIVIRSMMGLSLTFDHRVIDGAPAAEFLATILSLLENPARAVFE